MFHTNSSAERVDEILVRSLDSRLQHVSMSSFSGLKNSPLPERIRLWRNCCQLVSEPLIVLYELVELFSILP